MAYSKSTIFITAAVLLAVIGAAIYVVLNTSVLEPEKPIVKAPDANAVVFHFGEDPFTVRDLMIAFQEAHTFDEILAQQARSQSQSPDSMLGSSTILSVTEYLQEIATISAFEKHFAGIARENNLQNRASYITNHNDVVKEELYQKVLLEDILRPIKITEKDVRQHYNENRDTIYKMDDSDVFVIRGMYVRTDIRPVAEAEKRIREAYDKLETGDSFKKVASFYSDAEINKRGEEMHAAPEQFTDPEILDRIERLRDGDYTEIFESGNKLMIIQRVKHIPPKYLEFDKPFNQLLFRNAIMESKRRQNTVSLYQKLLAKYKPLLMSDLILEPEIYAPDNVVLSVEGVYELTLQEFENLAKQHSQTALQQKMDYFHLLVQKAIFVAEAYERGWSGKTVAPSVEYWDRKQLLKEYILASAQNAKLTEEKMQTYYEENKDKPAFQKPAVYDLYYLLVPADFSLQISHLEAKLRFERANQTASGLFQQMMAGRPFADIVALHSQDELLLQTKGHIGKVTLNQLDPVMSTAVANADLHAGEISRPQEVYNHKRQRYGYEIYYAKDKEDSRTMTYEEAKEVMKTTWVNGIVQQRKKTFWNSFLSEYPVQANQEILTQVERYLLDLAHYPSRHIEITNYLNGNPTQ